MERYRALSVRVCAACGAQVPDVGYGCNHLQGGGQAERIDVVPASQLEGAVARDWFASDEAHELMERWFEEWDFMSEREAAQYDGWLGAYVLAQLGGR